MRIQLLSDIHLEVERTPSNGVVNSDGDGDLYKFDFPADPEANALALLGDIGMTLDDRLFDWIRLQLSRFKLVFFVPGNHEPYWSTIEESRQRLLQFAEENAISTAHAPATECPIGRFVLLDRSRYDISPTLTVLGCTLWARLDPDELDILRWSVTDFKRIGGLTSDVYQALHAHDAEWLENSIAQIARDEPQRKIVVMTHHAPTRQEPQVMCSEWRAARPPA